MKKCSKCKQTKPKTEFHNHVRAKDGKQPHCKSCMKLQQSSNGYMRNYLRCTWRGRAHTILGGMKNSSKHRGHEWDPSWWTVDTILEKIENQRCAVTGVEFKIVDVKEGSYRSPFTPSPDRIDNSRGYEPDNVQWVVLIYNVMKSDFQDEDVAQFLLSLKYLGDSKGYKEPSE